MTMTLAATPRRSERSYPPFAGEHFPAQHFPEQDDSAVALLERVSDRLAARKSKYGEPQRPGTSSVADARPLCFATAAVVRHLRDLLRESVHEGSETCRNIGIKVQAFPLVNASSFASDYPLDRIDRVHALIGTSWLNAFSFVQLLATQIRHYTEGDAEMEQEVCSIWQQGSILADTAEMLARMTGQGPSVLSWLCGWVAAAVEVDIRLRAHLATSESYASGSHQMSHRVIAGRLHQVVAALDALHEISVPDVTRRPSGPWSAVSSAGKLIHIERRLPLVAICVSELPPVAWPSSLCASLAQEFSKHLPRSVDFAMRSWNNVQFSEHRISY